jgi:hypothetical protein
MKNIIKRILEFFGCVGYEEHRIIGEKYAEISNAYDSIYERYQKELILHMEHLKYRENLKVGSLLRFQEDFYVITDIKSNHSKNEFFENGVEKTLNLELKAVDNPMK